MIMPRLTSQGGLGFGQMILPGSLATLTLTLTIMCLLIKRNYKVGMVGIHLALLMPLVSTTLLSFKAWNLYQESTAANSLTSQATLLSMTSITSIYVFVTMMLIRPKKEEAPSTMDLEEKTITSAQ
jgi:hypothetical protein